MKGVPSALPWLIAIVAVLFAGVAQADPPAQPAPAPLPPPALALREELARADAMIARMQHIPAGVQGLLARERRGRDAARIRFLPCWSP